MLALVDGGVGALGQGHQEPGVVPGQAPLLPPEGAVDRGVHVEHPGGYGGEVVGLAGLGDPPGRKISLL